MHCALLLDPDAQIWHGTAASGAQRSWGATASTASSMAPPSFMLRSGDQPCTEGGHVLHC